MTHGEVVASLSVKTPKRSILTVSTTRFSLTMTPGSCVAWKSAIQTFNSTI